MKTKNLMTLFSGLCALVIIAGCVLLTVKEIDFTVAAIFDISIYVFLMIVSIIVLIKDKDLYLPKQNETSSSARMVLLTTTLAVVIVVVTLAVLFIR